VLKLNGQKIHQSFDTKPCTQGIAKERLIRKIRRCQKKLFNLVHLYVVQHDLGLGAQDRPISQSIHLLDTTQRYISLSTLDSATIVCCSIRETLITH